MWRPAEEKMNTDTAASGGRIEIGRITMDVQDHVRSTETNGGIRMSGTVVEELCDGKVGALGGTGLFVGNGAECHDDGDINTPGVVKNGPEDLLDTGDTGLVEGWRVVGWKRKLGSFAVLLRGTMVRTVLGFGALVLKTLEHLFDVAGH
jgi:hypothetical protein